MITNQLLCPLSRIHWRLVTFNENTTIKMEVMKIKNVLDFTANLHAPLVSCYLEENTEVEKLKVNYHIHPHTIT